MLIRRVLLITNPASRRGSVRESIARRAFADAGVTCDSLRTEAAGHARELALRHASAGYDAVFTLGGDGTAMDVIDALAPGGPAVGILAAGTGNLLARALRIPLGTRRAVRKLVAGSEARIDLGRLASGRRFAIGAGVGVDAAMIAGASATWKRRLGIGAYVVTGSVHVLRRRRFNARVVVDGAVVERPASVVLVANFGVLLNGLVTLGNGIRYDDGKLDVCIFDPVTVADALRITRKLLLRDFSPDRCMTYLQGSDIAVATDPSFLAQADGELIGCTPFQVTTEPLAARVLVPQYQAIVSSFQ